mgnify:CR=1 FL=1
MPFSFDSAQFERLFPFHLLLNKQLEIVHAGKSLMKMIDLPEGSLFSTAFSLKRPQLEQQSFEAMLLLQNSLVVIESKQPEPFLLRGQIEQVNDDLLLFAGSPWFGSMTEVLQRNLTLNDFAYHDPLIDLLHVIKTQEIATEEVKHLLNTVNDQKNELKKANKAVADFALFPMQSPDPLFRIDFSGAIILENPAAKKIESELIYNNCLYNAKDLWLHLITDIRANAPRHIVEVQAADQYYSFACIVLEEEGYINIYGRDITNQELLDRDLKRSANRLTSLISNLQSGILLENENRTIALANQQFCNIFAIPAPPEALIGSDCSGAAEQMKHLFKNPDAFVERIAELLHNKVTVTGDKLELQNGTVLRRDFIPIWSNNHYFGHMWVYDDVTEVEKREQTINQQKAFYEEILNKIPADIAVFDKDHRYLFLNPVAVKDPELRKWLIGKTDEDYVQYRNKPQKLVEDRRRIFNEVKQTGKLLSFEERVVLPDGTESYQLRNFHPVLNDSGEVELVIGYGLNITERKKLEQILDKARLTAEQASLMKDRFFATMSHEIRTPLNGIMGITELLSKTPLSEKQQEFISIIKMSEAHLLRIVNEVLDFEKIVRNEIALEESDIDIIKLLEDVTGIYKINAVEKNLTFTFNSNTDSLFVRADSYRISQIIHNLAGNAVKFTQQGGITVTVSATANENRMANVQIRISDTGIGIDADKMRKLFEPYSQGKSVIAKQYGGTGLGLSICKRLIDLQGGTIHVQSEEGKGTECTLSFTWPLALRTDTQVQTPTANELLLQDQKLHLLVAEDVGINQFLLKHMLEKNGFTFVITDNGLAALEEVKKSTYDAVLMDIEMPFMDGVEATRQIRQLPDAAKANIPIIALTANAIKGNREEYLAAGMNDFITKPFTEEQLTAVVKQVIARLATTVTTPIKKCYDLSYLKSLSEEEEFIVKMVNVFIASIPGTIDELKLAIHRSDYKMVAAVLHKLKPAAATMGMQQLKTDITALEQEIKMGTTGTDIQKRLQEVIHTFNECIVELQADFV